MLEMEHVTFRYSKGTPVNLLLLQVETAAERQR